MMIKSIIVLIAGLLNIILGFFIYQKNPKSPSNKSYFFLCLFGGLWAVVEFFELTVFNTHLHDILITKLVYIFGTLALLAYLLLAYNFPYKIKVFSKKIIYFIYALPSLIILLIIIGVLKMTDAEVVNNAIHIEVRFYEFLVFSIYFFMYVFWGVIILFKKYFQTTVVYRYQIMYLIIATFATFITVSIFSVILNLFNNFDYLWLGPIFMLLHFFVAGYLIFYRPGKIK